MAGNKNSGRKTDFSDEIAKRICDEIAGGKHLARVCREKWAPSRSTVSHWQTINPEFKAAMIQARIDGAWALYDQMFEIAERIPKDNAHASQQREHLRIMMWGLSKLVPHFADRMQLDVTTRADPRESQRRADARLIRMMGMLPGAPLAIEGTALRIRSEPVLVDQQS